MFKECAALPAKEKLSAFLHPPNHTDVLPAVVLECLQGRTFNSHSDYVIILLASGLFSKVSLSAY